MVGRERKFLRFEALKQPIERIEIQSQSKDSARFFSKLTSYFVGGIVEFEISVRQKSLSTIVFYS